MKIKLKQSSPFVWLVFVIFILIFGFVYVILMEPLGTVYNLFQNDSDLYDQTYQTFYERSQTIWVWLPLPIIISMILWALIKLQQRDDYGG